MQAPWDKIKLKISKREQRTKGNENEQDQVMPGVSSVYKKVKVGHRFSSTLSANGNVL